MSHTMILSYVTFIYFVSFVLYLFRIIFKKEFCGYTASLMGWVGILAHTLALIFRWKASYNLGFGHAPITNLYESLIFFAWSIMILYLVIELRIKNRVLGAFVVPIAFLIMAYASISPGVSNRIEPLIPALQSNWLTTHVLTCFMGYAAFTVAFGCGLL
jgi:ABC-type transport system involved in cytochrome c biogenesis permease subunit